MDYKLDAGSSPDIQSVWKVLRINMVNDLFTWDGDLVAVPHAIPQGPQGSGRMLSARLGPRCCREGHRESRGDLASLAQSNRPCVHWPFQESEWPDRHLL